MFADRAISSWWTPERVGFALHNYAEIAATVSLPAVEARADLDRAIASLTPRLSSIADRYFRRDFDQSEIAKEERCNQQRVSALVQDVRQEVAEILCRGVV